MDTLVIYDETGYVISTMSGSPSPREPIGIPFLWVDIPDGKRIKITDGIGVDVSVTPHRVILEDIPKTEIEELREYIDELEIAIIDLASTIITNGGDE